MISEKTVTALLAFRQERDWEQFHSPKNLAIAISVEAGELLERFQWTEDHMTPRGGLVKIDRVRDEMADITILLMYLAHDLGVDLDQAVARKLERNRERYPVEQSRGSAKKYDEL